MMTPEQSAAYVMGQAACLMAEVAGMQAENQRAAIHGQGVTFLFIHFEEVINKYSCHRNAAYTAFHEANSNV